MLKSIALSVLAVVGIGALLWFAKQEPSLNREGAESKLAVVRNESESSEASASQKNDALADIPKSARHLAQAVQKDARLKRLRDAIRAQEEKVEERRKVLSTIIRTKGIVYMDGNPPQSGSTVGSGRSALQEFHQLEQELVQLESQIACLHKYDSDQLMVYAAGLDLPDNSIREIYPKYLESNRQLEALKINGLGDTHPTVLAAKDELENFRKRLDEEIVKLRSTLNAQLEPTKDRLKSAKPPEDEIRAEAIQRGLDAQDFVDAKRDFETDQKLLQQMKLKLIEEQSALDK